MCEMIDRDGRSMNGRADFYIADDGTLQMDGPTQIVAVENDARPHECSADDFTFECRHGDGDWEPIDLPPPPGKIVLIPDGAVVRAVPRDPDYELPPPRRPRLVLDYGLGPKPLSSAKGA